MPLGTHTVPQQWSLAWNQAFLTPGSVFQGMDFLAHLLNPAL
jgi:hypothetical protein